MQGRLQCRCRAGPGLLGQRHHLQKVGGGGQQLFRLRQWLARDAEESLQRGERRDHPGSIDTARAQRNGCVLDATAHVLATIRYVDAQFVRHVHPRHQLGDVLRVANLPQAAAHLLPHRGEDPAGHGLHLADACVIPLADLRMQCLHVRRRQRLARPARGRDRLERLPGPAEDLHGAMP